MIDRSKGLSDIVSVVYGVENQDAVEEVAVKTIGSVLIDSF